MDNSKAIPTVEKRHGLYSVYCNGIILVSALRAQTIINYFEIMNITVVYWNIQNDNP
jgi:hypothetical protein